MSKNMIKMLAAGVAVAAMALGIEACNKAAAASDDEPVLKEVFKDRFMIGAAMNVDQSSGRDSVAASLVARHFNTIVAENCMKSEKINPAPGVYEWQDADDFVAFGEKNNMFIVGHCLVWHSQLAPWFAVDENGNDVDSLTLVNRMRDHIYTVVGRYKGRVHGWDVVNEAIVEDGSYRDTPFYRIIGPDYIPLAFQFAHEADPDAELYINDYGMNVPGRRDAYRRLAADLKGRGLRLDAIGLQGHMGMDYPDLDQWEAAIDTLALTGCNLMVTEFEISALPTIHEGANVADTVAFSKIKNPYPDSLPADVQQQWEARMMRVFDIVNRHSDVITRFNVWGVSDGDSWKNDWPMPGRTDYPLLFDRQHQLKPVMQRVAANM